MLVQWDVASQNGVLVARMGEALFSLAVNHAANRVAAGSRTGTIYEFDLEAKSLIRQWKRHEGAVFSLKYMDEVLLSAGNDGRVVRWKGEEKVAESRLSEGSIRAVEITGDELWVCGAGGKIWCLHKETLEEKRRIDPVSSSSLFALQWAGETIFVAGRDAKLIRLPLNGTEEKERNVDAHWFSIHALALSPDRKYLASGSMDKTIKLWDAASLDLLKVIDRERFEAHASSVNTILWLSGNTFVSGGDDRRILSFQLDPSPIFAP